MPNYTVKDEKTNKTITFEWMGDEPPTEADMEEVFAAANPKKQPNGVTGSWEPDKATTQRMANMASNIPGDAATVAKGAYGLLRHPIDTLGAVGESLGGAAYDLTHMTDEQKTALKQKVIADVQDPMGTVNTLMDKAADYVEEKPVQAALMALSPSGPKTATTATKAAMGVVRPTERAVTGALEKTITKGIEKGIRPGVEGKGTFTMSQKYLRNAQDAVEHIVENKGNLRLTSPTGDIERGLPKNLKQFSEAIEQTKRSVFDQYNALTVQAGKGKATIDLVPISRELKTIADDPKLRKFAPGIADYAKKRSDDVLTGEKTIGLVDAQDSIAIMNKSLEAFYKNPTYENASTAYIDSLIANNLRKSLDSVIEREIGPGYADLKRSYGSLKAIEKDVGKRAVVDARKNVKGLIDFSDIFSGSTAIHGILSMNPSLVASGATAKMISALYRIKNDPNRIISGMFSRTEQLMDKRNKIRAKARP
jgi:hypothetical protein